MVGKSLKKQSKIILCDIGNTTFHFRSKNKDFKISHKEKLPKLKGNIYFISVNKKATTKLLEKYPSAVDLKPYIKFDTKYTGMGIDRQVGCLNITNGVVVDAGSAITVDVIKDGIHQGGFILPGLRALINIYPKISKKLKFDFDSGVELSQLPLATNDAINYAILQSIILPIKNISKNSKIIFTGGDGKLLSNYFSGSKYNKNLIFDNIKLLLDKSQI